jgi:hypothetical protein
VVAAAPILARSRPGGRRGGDGCVTMACCAHWLAPLTRPGDAGTRYPSGSGCLVQPGPYRRPAPTVIVLGVPSANAGFVSASVAARRAPRILVAHWGHGADLAATRAAGWRTEQGCKSLCGAARGGQGPHHQRAADGGGAGTRGALAGLSTRTSNSTNPNKSHSTKKKGSGSWCRQEHSAA